MHGSVHPREVGAPQGPRVARDGVRKKQLPHMVSHVGLASAGQQLSRGGAIWATVEAHHLP